MASVTRPRRFPVGLIVIVAIALGLAGLLAVQWLTHLVWTVVRMLMILAAIGIFARIGLYLLRNGGSRPA